MLLLIESGSKVFREYILGNASKNNISIGLYKKNRATWERKWISEVLALTDLAPTSSSRFSGITTYDEHSLLFTAQVAQELELPYYSPDLVRNCQSKYKLRKMLVEKDITKIESYIVRDYLDAKDYAKSLAFPVVLKPEKGYGSISVFRAETERDLLFYFNDVAESFPEKGSYVIEPYIDGLEVSLEVLVHSGEIFYIGITDKLLSAEPYFEEVGHVFPSYRHRKSEKELKDYITKLIGAFQIENGTIHAEVRLTAKGPELIELNLRLGGDFIPLLIKYSTGFDLASSSFKMALGGRPDIIYTRNKGTCIRFIIPSRSGTIRDIEGLENLKHPNIVKYNIRQDLNGLEVKLPPEGFLVRLGYFIVEADTSREAERMAADILSGVRVNYVK